MTTRAEDYLLQTAPSWITRVVGWICALIGVALIVLDVFFVYKMVSNNVGFGLPALALLLVPALLAWFFLRVGHRLLGERTNGRNSLFSPKTWTFLCLFFAACAILGVVTAVHTASLLPVQGILASALFSLLSYGASKHFGGKERRKNAP